MKICYFGDYEKNYPRHKVLVSGLRKNGVEVLEKRIDSKGFKKFLEMSKVLTSLSDDVDCILVGYSNSRLVWFVRLFTTKPIVWNAFYSLYDNWIHDRKLASPTSAKALYYWLLDWICCQSAHKIILETEADIDYFVRTFGVSRDKFFRIFVGYDEEIMRPMEREESPNTFAVEFHGKYIPVQGVNYIIEAAHLLREHTDIKFMLIGSGQTYNEISMQAKNLNVPNVVFIERAPFKEIPKYLANADVAIGLVGTVSRVEQAIPNKVYEASAMKRASINANTKAIKELFVDKESILLVNKGDPQDLAKKILMLKENPELKEKIAEGAYNTVRERASTLVLGKELRKELEKLVH